MAKCGRRATYEERLSICRLIESGESPNRVVEKSGFGRSTVFGWWQTYRRAGPEGLRTKRTPGPAANLNDGQLAQLRAVIVESGRRGPYSWARLWTRKSVGRVIDEVFGVRLSPVSIGRVLERIGISLVNPLTRRDADDASAAWPDGVPATFGAEARKAGAAVYYVWIAPLGRTDSADPHGRVLFCAQAARREVRFRSVGGDTDADAFIHMCEALLREGDRPAVVITESTDATRSQKTVMFFASTHGRLSLLLLATNRDLTHGEEPTDCWQLTLRDARPAAESTELVVVSGTKRPDHIEHELVLRLFRRRLETVMCGT
jgi:transposase